MKKNLFIIALMLGASITSHAQSYNVASVGKFISEETAHRWMNNFKKAYPSITTQHSFDKSLLNIMLTDRRVQGVYFYNALNEDGSVTMIPVGCDQQTTLLATTSAAIDNFRNTFPERAQAQLVGRNILSKLLEIDGVAAILVANAIDDQGTEKLVYIAVDQKNVWISGTADGSMPCPPYCAKPTPTLAIATNILVD